MSKIKKILAVLVTLAMVMAMSVTAFADVTNTMPKPSDKVSVTVSGVESGMTVTAYQIVKGDYDTQTGFIGYSAVGSGLVSDPLNPSYNEIMTIAHRIDTNDSTLPILTSRNMTEANGVYSAELEAGYWIVLVRSGEGTTSIKMYNPMLVSAYYSVAGSGDSNHLEADNITANDNWTLIGGSVVAKSSNITLTKNSDVATNDLGADQVTYTVETTIPDYSSEYEAVTFTIEDEVAKTNSVAALEIKTDTIKVYVNSALVSASDNTYTLTAATEGYTVAFDSNYVKANVTKAVKVVYDAKIKDSNLNNASSHDNTVKLTFTHTPGKTQEITATEKEYTFEIGGSGTGNIIQKVKAGDSANELVPLAGAVFTLYTNEACTKKYTNDYHKDGTTTSAADGNINIKGLSGTGTYYLKETDAPNGFSINPTVYKIVVNATFNTQNTNELTGWTVTISEVGNENAAVTNTYTITADGLNKTEQITQIKNTTISALPSTGGIGTTIFTVGGCLIMIAAAALFFVSRRKASNK